MQLQMNNSGAWKHVTHVTDQLAEHARLAAQNLGLVAYAAGSRVGWRLVDEGQRVLAHWTPQGGWLEHTTPEQQAARRNSQAVQS